MTETTALGIDGCRYGWVAAKLGNGAVPEYSLHRDLEQMKAQIGHWDLVLIDMPIGLPTQSPRACDREARKRLGRRRAASVFPVPCRAALGAADYRGACEINRRFLGVALPKQTWNIFSKIRELDAWIRGQAPGTVRECHPELAFWALNGQQAMTHAKRTNAGQTERLRLLENFLPGIERTVDDARTRWPKSFVTIDDILDATVLALSALAGPAALIGVPREAEWDEAGLPCEIVYPAPNLALVR